MNSDIDKHIEKLKTNAHKDGWIEGYKEGANTTWKCIYAIINLVPYWFDIFEKHTLQGIIESYSPIQAFIKIRDYENKLKNKCESKCDDCMYYAPNINANSTCLNGASCTQEPCQSYETRKDQ
jgi:hypothetical protein